MRIPTKKLLNPFFYAYFAMCQKKKTCKVLIYRDFLCFAILSSGETGIRTPDTLLGYTRFPGVSLLFLLIDITFDYYCTCLKIKQLVLLDFTYFDYT